MQAITTNRIATGWYRIETEGGEVFHAERVDDPSREMNGWWQLTFMEDEEHYQGEWCATLPTLKRCKAAAARG